MSTKWQSRVGEFESAVERLVSERLLREATPAEKLNLKLRVPELKRLLSKKGLRTNGKKTELVQRLLSSVSLSDAEALVADVRLYRATDEGQRKLEEYQELVRQMASAMEADALRMLTAGNVEEAIERIQSHKHLVESPMPTSDVERRQAYEILRLDLEDLPLDPTKRREVVCMLALTSLLGESYVGAVARLRNLWHAALLVPGLTSFMAADQDHPHLKSYDSDCAQDAFELYLQTKVHQAHCAAELTDILSERGLGGIKGISVVRSDDDACPLCKGRARKYRWSEQGNVPKLPNHWGCTCWYSLW